MMHMEARFNDPSDSKEPESFVFDKNVEGLILEYIAPYELRALQRPDESSSDKGDDKKGGDQVRENGRVRMPFFQAHSQALPNFQRLIQSQLSEERIKAKRIGLLNERIALLKKLYPKEEFKKHTCTKVNTAEGDVKESSQSYAQVEEQCQGVQLIDFQIECFKYLYNRKLHIIEVNKPIPGPKYKEIKSELVSIRKSVEEKNLGFMDAAKKIQQLALTRLMHLKEVYPPNRITDAIGRTIEEVEQYFDPSFTQRLFSKIWSYVGNDFLKNMKKMSSAFIEKLKQFSDHELWVLVNLVCEKVGNSEIRVYVRACVSTLVTDSSDLDPNNHSFTFKMTLCYFQNSVLAPSGLWFHEHCVQALLEKYPAFLSVFLSLEGFMATLEKENVSDVVTFIIHKKDRDSFRRMLNTSPAIMDQDCFVDAVINQKKETLDFLQIALECGLSLSATVRKYRKDGKRLHTVSSYIIDLYFTSPPEHLQQTELLFSTVFKRLSHDPKSAPVRFELAQGILIDAYEEYGDAFIKKAKVNKFFLQSFKFIFGGESPVSSGLPAICFNEGRVKLGVELIKLGASLDGVKYSSVAAQSNKKVDARPNLSLLMHEVAKTGAVDLVLSLAFRGVECKDAVTSVAPDCQPIYRAMQELHLYRQQFDDVFSTNSADEKAGHVKAEDKQKQLLAYLEQDLSTPEEKEVLGQIKEWIRVENELKPERIEFVIKANFNKLVKSLLVGKKKPGLFSSVFSSNNNSSSKPTLLHKLLLIAQHQMSAQKRLEVRKGV